MMRQFKILLSSLLLSSSCLSGACLALDINAPKEAISDSTQNSSTENALQHKDAAIFPNGKKITVDEVKKIWDAIPPSKKGVSFSEDYLRILLLMVDQEKISQAAEKEGITKSPEFIKKKDELIQLLHQKNFLENKSKDISEKDPEFKTKEKKSYDELIVKHPDYDDESFEIRHILFKDDVSAKAAYEEVLKGGIKKFEEKLSLSLDKKSTNGNIGKIRKKMLPKEVVTAIGQQRNGLACGKPIQMFPGSGYSVIWIVSREKLNPPSIDSKEGKELTWNALKQSYIMKALELVKKEAKVVFYGPDAKKIEDVNAKADFSSTDFSKIDPKLVVAELTTGNGVTKITYEEMGKNSEDLLQGSQIDSNSYKDILMYVVDKMLISISAKESKVSESNDVKESVKMMEQGLAQNMFLEKKLDQLKPTIEESKIKEKYQEILKIDKTEVRIRHIIAKTKEEADKIIAELKANPTADGFKKVEEKHAGEKGKNSDLGMIPLNIFPENIAAKIKETSPGTIILESFPIPGMNGFLIIRLEDRKIVAPPTFEEVSPKIRESFAKEKLKSEIEKLPTEGIKIIDFNGKEKLLSDLIKEGKEAEEKLKAKFEQIKDASKKITALKNTKGKISKLKKGEIVKAIKEFDEELRKNGVILGLTEEEKKDNEKYAKALDAEEKKLIESMN